MATSQPVAAARTAIGATSKADGPTRRVDEQNGGEGHSQHRRRPRGDPGCNRRRRVQPWQDVGGDHRGGDADRNRRKDRSTPESGAERQRVGETLGQDEEDQHPGRSLGDDSRQLGLTREEDEVDRPVGGRTKDDRERADGEPGNDQQRDGAKGRLRRDAMRQMADGDDDPGTTAAMSRHQARSVMRTLSYGGSEGSARLVWCSPLQPATPVKTSAPVPAATNPGRSARPICCAGIFPPAAVTSNRRNAAINGPPKSAATAANAPARTRSWAPVPSEPNQPNGERAQTEPERDQRCLGTENEPESQTSRARRGECWRARSEGSGPLRDLPGENVRRGPVVEPQLQRAALRARERG